MEYQSSFPFPELGDHSRDLCVETGYSFLDEVLPGRVERRLEKEKIKCHAEGVTKHFLGEDCDAFDTVLERMHYESDLRDFFLYNYERIFSVFQKLCVKIINQSEIYQPYAMNTEDLGQYDITFTLHDSGSSGRTCIISITRKCDTSLVGETRVGLKMPPEPYFAEYSFG